MENSDHLPQGRKENGPMTGSAPASPTAAEASGSGPREGHSSPSTASGRGSPATPKAVVEKQLGRRIFKIIVIGDSNVGKTCLTYRFCAGRFPDKTEATIGVDFREKTIDVDGETVKLQLWDTAGQERFRKSMVQHYYRNVHAVVFAYDVTKVSSFENLPHWVEECNRNHLTSDIPRILVGNKCDMKDKVAVNTNNSQKFADSHNMPLFETSAKDDHQSDHVEAIFLTLAHKLRNAKPMMPPSAAGYGYSASNRVVTISRQASGEDSNDKSSCPC